MAVQAPNHQARGVAAKYTMAASGLQGRVVGPILQSPVGHPFLAPCRGRSYSSPSSSSSPETISAMESTWSCKASFSASNSSILSFKSSIDSRFAIPLFTPNQNLLGTFPSLATILQIVHRLLTTIGLILIYEIWRWEFSERTEARAKTAGVNGQPQLTNDCLNALIRLGFSNLEMFVLGGQSSNS